MVLDAKVNWKGTNNACDCVSLSFHQPKPIFYACMSSHPATSSSVPPHQLSESPNSRSINVCGWTITATTRPIITASEADTLHKTLGLPLPEIIFGNNSLELLHESTGWKYRFDTPEALKWVKNGELGDGDGGVKVDYAEKWLRSRYVDPSLL